MIRRLVEYAVRCDAPDCGESEVFGDRTREECAASATKHGWKATTRNRWLCPDCVKAAERMRTKLALSQGAPK